MSDNEMVTAKNVDLSNCDREQIQYCAATLEHGFLLVLSEPELTVIQAGENAPGFLGGTLLEVLGSSLGAWVTPELMTRLQQRVTAIRSDCPPVHVAIEKIGENTFDIFVHRCGASLIVEFELRQPESLEYERDIYSTVHGAIAQLQKEPTVADLLNLAVKQIREFTGFDRVMAYQFLEDGSGAVLAEAVTQGLEPFLGLHYPPSDIPLPARRLFKLCWLRHQPDIGYTPVRIVPENNPLTRQPLDLSYAMLRSVSVMYSQYLKNMGTQASMVMTLLKNGELWGLVACHHHSGPRHVPFYVRAACEFLAHMVSLLLAAKEDQEQSGYREQVQAAHAHVTRALATNNDLVKVLIDHRPGLLDYCEAGGAALILDGRPVLLGSTPEAEQVSELVEWLAANRSERVFATDCLSSLYPAAGAYTRTASGVIAIRIASSRKDYILWFRPEWEQMVSWAGDPHKPVDTSDDGLRLFPRTSFAIWKETVRGKSRPWQKVELEGARALLETLLELVVQRADHLQFLFENLQRSHAELDAFAYIASHDLKEPLRGIHNYTQFVLEDVGDALPATALNQLQSVVRLTRRMDELLDSLLQYARLGRQGMEMVPCDLNLLVADVLDTLAPRVKQQGVEVRVLGPLPTVVGDRARLGEVFMNLISNALKYNDKEQRIVEIGSVSSNGETLHFVRDNGIGIAPEYHETIFAIFRRLHAQERFGGGTGAGLTITRKILERHDGRIWVESKPGEGATFYFTIGTK